MIRNSCKLCSNKMKTFQYNTVDLFKLFAAVLIVFRHTYNGDWAFWGDWIKQVLTTACVPFFFLCSGFFLRKGMEQRLQSGGEVAESQWFRQYIWRLAKMYIAWSALTFPVAVMLVNRGHPEYGIGMKLLYHIRLFFLTGSIGVYWYLLALIICAIGIRWCYKRNLLRPFVPVSLLLFLLGCAYDSPLNQNQLPFQMLHIIFGSERNFLTVGLFYVLLGFIWDSVSPFQRRVCRKGTVAALFFCFIMLRTGEVFILRSNYTQALVAISAFLLATTHCGSTTSSFYMAARHLSIGLFLIHFPFVLLFDFYLRKGTIIDFPVTLLFSVIVYYLLTYLPPIVSKTLLGHYVLRQAV